jgi:hypothetical protein
MHQIEAMQDEFRAERTLMDERRAHRAGPAGLEKLTVAVARERLRGS